MSVSTARAVLAILCAGAITFVLVYVGLGASWSRVAAQPAILPPTPTPLIVAAADSVAPRIARGNVAVALPTTGAEALLRDVHVGDRLSVLASMSAEGRPATAVVVNGAIVVQPPAGDDPLLIEVSAPDGMALAHLIASGTRLTYTLWSANAPPTVAPIDESAARTALGLSPSSTPTPTSPAAPAPSPTSAVVPTPVPSQAQTYTVQPGDTLDSIAGKVGADVGALWWANRALVDPGPLAPGMQLTVPNVHGFLYQVQPGDTWDSIGTTFGLAPIVLEQLNQPATPDPPAPGALIFIPRPS